MAVQDVRTLVPRVRRAIEGPVPLLTGDPDYLTDDQVAALVADTVADVILLTEGQWGHQLIVVDRDESSGAATEWGIDPELEPEEESIVAAQAALSRHFHIAMNLKTSERIQNEGQEWEYARSAQLLKEQFALLKDMRDRALAAVMKKHPVLARYASILAVRDRVGAAYIEPWVDGGLLDVPERTPSYLQSP